MTENVTKKEKVKIELFEYGSIIFGVGLLIAIISSFFQFEGNTLKIIIWTQIVLGIIIGVANITRKESLKFLTSSSALILISAPIITLQTTSGLFNISLLQFMIQPIYQNQALYIYFLNFIVNLMSLIVPATIVVSLKTLFLTTKD